MYYKIKKKKEQTKDVEVHHDEESISSPPKEAPQESPVSAPKDSIWGAHLNKTATAETPKTPTGSSPCLNYSKLTEKLMKGAKINIRSSLSRRLSSNRVSNSPKVGTSSQPSTPNETLLNEDSNNSFMLNSTPQTNNLQTQQSASFLHTPVDSQISEEPSNSIDGIESFKPKIVHKKTVQKAFSVQNAASTGQALKAPKRTVDLGWLDDCLAVENSAHGKPTDDDDIVYSSEDEGRKSKRKSIIIPPKARSPLNCSTMQTSHDEDHQTELPVMKRKFDEEEENIEPKKRQKVESSLEDTQMGLPKEPREDCYEFEGSPVKSTRKASVSAENPTIAAKRDRLAKYL